jgi:hypothetical protein
MAVVDALITVPVSHVAIVSWLTLLDDDTGDAQVTAHYADKTVTVTGTFGASGSVTLQGSNDGSIWHTLVDPQGNDLTFTAAGIEQVLENPLYLRPIVTVGDGTTDLDVILSCKGVA